MITIRFVLCAASFLFWLLHVGFGVTNGYEVIKGAPFPVEARVGWSYLLSTFILFVTWASAVAYAYSKKSSVRNENRSPDLFTSRTISLLVGFVYWVINAIFMIAVMADTNDAAFDADTNPWWVVRLQILYTFMLIIAVYAFFEMWSVGHSYGYTLAEQLEVSTSRKTLDTAKDGVVETGDDVTRAEDLDL